MRVLCLWLLILVSSSASAHWPTPAVNLSDWMTSMVNRIDHYISGKGDVFKQPFYTTAATVDTMEFVDLASGERWVLVKADAVDKPGHTGSTHMTATIITYGLAGSLVITLLSLGFGIREFLKEC